MPTQEFVSITSKEVIGFMFQEMEASKQRSWVPLVANEFTSTQASELYAGLGTVPAMREWLGGKQGKALSEQSLRITNKDWESTLAIKVKDMRRDKTGYIRTRVGELMDRALTHEAKLLSDLILAGTGTTLGACYDGVALFSDSHAVKNSGTIDNNIDVDISAVPTAEHGSTTAPSVGEFAYAVLAATKQLYGFKDDQGEPINEMAKDFLVMVPVGLSDRAQLAAGVQYTAQGENNPLKATGLNFNIQVNPRLTWTDKFAVFRTDGRMKTLISQVEDGPNFKALAEGSDHEFTNAEHLYSVEKSGNVGYGKFDNAVLVTLV